MIVVGEWQQKDSLKKYSFNMNNLNIKKIIHILLPIKKPNHSE